MSNRITFYYQTIESLDAILGSGSPVTHIHVSSVHFGLESDGEPYIHLNNHYPDDGKFTQMWSDLEQAQALGIKIVLMIGGAGGGFASLFANYSTCYALLKDVLQRHPVITGIDLDVEEPVKLENLRMLLRDLKRDFGSEDFTFSMAPVQSALESDEPGMGGFSYKELWNTPEGGLIDYFNGQFYSDFSVDAYDRVIANGYPANKVVMGSLNGSGDVDVLIQLVRKYPDFGGVYSWEYYDTHPSPYVWAVAMDNIFHPLLTPTEEEVFGYCCWIVRDAIAAMDYVCNVCWELIPEQAALWTGSPE